MTQFLEVVIIILIVCVSVAIIALLSPRVRLVMTNFGQNLLVRWHPKKRLSIDEDSDATEIVFDSVDFAYLQAKSTTPGVPSRIGLYSDQSVVVGRNRHECQVVIREHSISRQHAEFIPKDDAIYIRNLSRTGGTFVNQKRLPVDELQRLDPGDLVRFFKYEYQFLLEEERTLDMGEPDTINTPVVDDWD